MSRYAYDIALEPPKAYEAVEGAVSILKASGLLVSSSLYLAASTDIYGHEEPVDKPTRWVLVSQFQQLAGQVIESPDSVKVVLHVKVVGERDMLPGPNRTHQAKITAAQQWHAAMHDRIAEALIGKTTTLTFSDIGLRYRQLSEPARVEYYRDTDTRESFALYAVTLQPKP